MNCCEFFSSIPEGQKPCKVLQTKTEDEQVAWESQVASAHSPGPVCTQEILARQVVDPTHFDNVTGTIKPTFFDDASSIGASCHRLSHTTPEAIQEITTARVSVANQNPPPSGLRQAIGYASISVEEVRAIQSEIGNGQSRRGAGVYDTAKHDDASHADICQLVSGTQKGKSIRAQLWRQAKDKLVRFSVPEEALAE